MQLNVSFSKFLLLISFGMVLAMPAMALWPVLSNATFKLELWLNPVVSDFRAADWRFDSKKRLWSARISGVKDDKDCIFKPKQVVTASIQVAPNALPFEAGVVFLNDKTPDSNRPPGAQDFGRWEFDAPNVVRSSIARVGVQHICEHREPKIVTTILGPFIVGAKPAN